MGQVFWCDADARILDDEPCLRCGGTQTHLHMPASMGIANRIVKQVHDDLDQSRFIPNQGNWLRLLDIQLDSSLVR